MWLVSLWLGALVTGYAAPSAWAVRVWRSDGLPDSTVGGLAQTPDGFLWVTTSQHMARFDGNRFEPFSIHDLIPSPDVAAKGLLATRDGALWIMLVDGKVVRFSTHSVRVFGAPLPDSPPLSVVEDRDGAVWIGYSDGSIGRIRGDSVRRFTSADGLPEGNTAVVTADAEGRVWFGKAEHIGVFRNDRFQSLAQTDRLQKRLCAARNGGIWVCTGLRLFSCSATGNLVLRGGVPAKNSGTRATAMLEDHNGVLWIGTSPGGLVRYDGQEFQNVPTSDPDITSLFEDRENNLWVGTDGGGIDLVRPRAVAIEGNDTSLSSDSVRLLCQDASGKLWGTTQDRTLVQRTETGWSPVPDDTAKLHGVRVTAVAAAADGGLWLGSDIYNLYRLNGGTITRWQRTNGQVSRTITALATGRDGRVWIAGANPVALQSFDGASFARVALPASARVLRVLAESPTGEIWAGGDHGQLWRVSDGRVSEETAVLPPVTARISSLRFSSDGALWIGYVTGGVARLRDGRASVIGTAQGLYDDAIAQIVADDQGWIWFGSSKGLFRVRRDDLTAVAEGRAARVQSVRFAPQGIPTLHASFDDVSSAVCGPDGRLWIPMGPELAVIDPRQLRDNFVPPPILIRRVTIDERPVAQYGAAPAGTASPDLRSLHGELVLAPVRRKMEIEFTGISFGDPENVRFRYRLDGFDTDWVDAGTQRSVSYARLDPGRYRFEVKACNSDGIWNEHPAILAFTIAPLWWQTWWFRLMAGAALLGAIFAVVRYVSLRRLQARLRTLEQQAALDKERSRIARDLHDDLGGRLTQIVLLNELALQDTGIAEPTRERAREMSGAMRQVIKALDETVWALNPRNDTLPDLIDYLSQFAVEFLRAADICCRVDLPDHPPKVAVPADVRHHLFLVVKEALNNVVRHARAATVKLAVGLENRRLTVVIEDDGCGLGRTPPDSHADGLHNMRGRMQEIGGTFEIASTSNGTRISLQWTLPS